MTTTNGLRDELRGLTPEQRLDIANDTWLDGTRLAEKYAVTLSDVRSVIKSLEELSGSWRFDWLQAINRLYGQGVIRPGTLAVAVAIFGFSKTESAYVWPNQKTLAERCGWAASNKYSLLKALKQLEDVGALYRIAAKDCPPDVSAKILSGKADGGSGRDIRAVAYGLVPADKWQMGNRYPNQLPNKVAKPATLNHKAQPQPAAPDSLPIDDAVTQLPSPHVDRSHILIDGEKRFG